jgi:hypothetical protein
MQGSGDLKQSGDNLAEQQKNVTLNFGTRIYGTVLDSRTLRKKFSGEYPIYSRIFLA